MFKSKLAKSIIALVAVVIVAIAIPAAIGANNVEASGDYTYKSEDAKNAAVRKWNDSRLSDTQKKLVRAANDEAAASTGFTSSIYKAR